MITQWFENPKKPIPVVTDYKGAYTESKAKARNLSVFEYEKRKTLVEEEVAMINYKVGDMMYPYHEKDYKEHGKVRVSGICGDYDHYGEVPWNAKSPFIVQVASTRVPGTYVNCSSGWVTTAPQYLTESEDQC